MRYGRLLAVLAVYIFLTPASASAQTISASQQVQVQAVVPAVQLIIVNKQSKITEIISNSAQAVTPQVYMGRIADSTARPLTDDIYKQYQQLTFGNLRTGVIYRANPTDINTSFKKLNLLSISAIRG